MVIIFDAQDAETPEGKPVGVPMPVAPVVVWVKEGMAVLIHTLGDDEAPPTVLLPLTVIVPVALALPQPPVKGML